MQIISALSIGSAEAVCGLSILNILKNISETSQEVDCLRFCQHVWIRWQKHKFLWKIEDLKFRMCASMNEALNQIEFKMIDLFVLHQNAWKEGNRQRWKQSRLRILQLKTSNLQIDKLFQWSVDHHPKKGPNEWEIFFFFVFYCVEFNLDTEA